MEVNVGFVVVVVVEVAFVLLEKHVQEMKEEEKRLRWLFFFEEMENLRFIVGVWRWVLSGNICVVEIVGEGERSSSMTCSYGFISWQTMSIISSVCLSHILELEYCHLNDKRAGWLVFGSVK